MKSVIAPLLLAVVAVVQALGRYMYHQDTIVVTGQMFFPIFLAGISIFYALRAKTGAYGTVKLALLILAVVAAALTAAGWGMALFWFYPSIWIYYAAFLLLVVYAVVSVLSTPSAKQTAKQSGADEADEADAHAEPTEGARGASVAKQAEVDGGSDGGWRTTGR
ncbi:hypothetical protein [Kocuria sp. JC486]|uniref:hypothetical protein n=1 Tax=Kocuria sp. JC486 TaxID=1970736 RepID=UPI001ADDB283|nr:hypothetical protein [Kocuria sp. JC486]